MTLEIRKLVESLMMSKMFSKSESKVSFYHLFFCTLFILHFHHAWFYRNKKKTWFVDKTYQRVKTTGVKCIDYQVVCILHWQLRLAVFCHARRKEKDNNLYCECECFPKCDNPPHDRPVIDNCNIVCLMIFSLSMTREDKLKRKKSKTYDDKTLLCHWNIVNRKNSVDLWLACQAYDAEFQT